MRLSFVGLFAVIDSLRRGDDTLVLSLVAVDTDTVVQGAVTLFPASGAVVVKTRVEISAAATEAESFAAALFHKRVVILVQP